MEITPGWETVEIGDGPVRPRRSPHRREPARPGLAHDLAQIIADEIGVDAAAEVRVVHGDTDRTPYGWGTFASRSLVIAGGAITAGGAKDARQSLIGMASHVLEAAADDIVLEDGSAKVSGTDRAVPIAALARAAYHQAHLSRVRSSPGLPRPPTTIHPAPFPTPVTSRSSKSIPKPGGVSRKILVVEDAGRIINPLIADGQVHGGVAQGIGNALFEEIIYDETATS